MTNAIEIQEQKKYGTTHHNVIGTSFYLWFDSHQINQYKWVINSWDDNDLCAFCANNNERLFKTKEEAIYAMQKFLRQTSGLA